MVRDNNARSAPERNRVNPTRAIRAVLWMVDGVGLIGVVIFSVLAALESDNRLYVIGQIVSAALILGSVLLMRLINQRPPE
jgi:hypothetical protein